MAYRFDGLSGRILFDNNLLWEYEDLLNYRFLSFYSPSALVNSRQNIEVSQTGFAIPKPLTAEPTTIEKRVISEGPLFLPPIVQNDTIVATSLVRLFDLFADNGFGVDSDPDGDPLTITQINGVAVIQGQQVALNNGISVTYFGSGDVEFSITGVAAGTVATDIFTYTVDDGNGEVDVATVNISFAVIALELGAIPFGSGVRIFAAPDGSISGSSVSNLGDINGDNVDDFIIGAPGQGTFAGIAYVIFGNAGGLPDNISLADLNGTGGFRIDGLTTLDDLGSAVSDAGDINGDGINDILIGAPGVGPQNAFNEGQGAAYVIFGTNGGFPANFDLATLNGTNGFTISSRPGDIGVGFSMSAAGDVNGDGFQDILVGSKGNSEIGVLAFTFVVYGTNAGFPANFDLGQLDGTNGFVIDALGPRDGAGQAVTGLGDIDGDGIDDFAVGAPGADGAFGTSSFTGEVYVILGRAVGAAGFGASFDLSTLNGANGFVINAIGPGVDLGRSITNIGDVNGDGLADILVAAPFADSTTGGTSVGQAYVIYGASSFSASLNLSSLNGVNGFIIDGIGEFNGTGLSVSGIGDFNGDGVGDFIIGASAANPNGNVEAGQTYVVFGGNFSINAVFDLAALDGTNGFALFGASAGDLSGGAVSGAGDVNGDGFADLLIGAVNANDVGNGPQGESYIIYGFDPAAAGNNPPIANDDAFTIGENSNFSGDIFADNGNGIDSDPDGDNFFVSLINGQVFTIGDTFDINGGTVTVTGNGTFDFTTGGNFEFLGVDEQSVGSLTYTINDGNGGTATATATITVTGVNDAPVGFDPGTGLPPANPLDYIPTQNHDDGATITDLNLSAFFVDPDTSDTVTISVDIAALPPGLLYNLATNTISGTPTASASQGGLANDGVYIVQVTATDQNGASFTTNVTYNIFNPAPIAQNDSQTTDEATAINGDVFAANGNGEDADPDGDVFSVTNVNGDTFNVGAAVAGSAGGLFVINANGTFSFDPGGDFDGLNAGDSNDTTVTYTIDDGEGGTSTAMVTVTVNGINAVNIPPVASDDAFTTDEDNAVSGNVFDDNGNGADEDLNGDIFAVSMVSGSAANVGANIAGSNGGLFSIRSNGMFNFQPNGEFDGLAVGETATSTATYTIDDGNGGTSTATVMVTITGVNDAPIALDDTLVGDPDFNTFNLLADNGNGVDSDPDGAALVITEINGIAVQPGSDIELQSGLTIRFNGVGEIELRTLQPGLYNEIFTYTVSDGQGGTSTATVTAQFTVDSINLADVNEFGSTFNGVAAGDESGFSVSAAGDVNGDGFADFMIGAHFAGPNAGGDPGATYVIFGGTNGPVPQGQDFNLSDIDGTNGFVLTGIDQFDNSGWSIAAPGDINGDGIDDILISGHLADTNGGQSGEVYVVFGGQNFGVNFDLGSLNGTNGFVINGIDAVDQAGYEVAGVGDLNGDGINDFIIGARGADTDGDNHTGEAYVVFGSTAGFDATFELADLDGTNGFTIEGVTAEGFLGAGLASTPGDFDGDGVSDAFIGIPGIDGQPGQALILFGDADGFNARVSVDNLAGAGILISGVDPSGQAGFDLTGLGDVNGDGIDDFALSAPFADPGGLVDAGEVYIIFGGAAIRNGVDLGALDGTNGFVISGLTAGENIGFSVGAPGDFDGDGINDILIGAPSADGTGGAALIYGRTGGFPANFDIDSLNGNNGFHIDGIAAGDDAGFAVTGIGDIDGDGRDDLLIGAPGANAGGLVNSGQSYVLPGFSRGGSNPAEEIVEKRLLPEVFTGDGSGNNVNVSELPLTPKPSIPDDDGFVFVEKALVPEDLTGWRTDFGDFVIDQDVMAEFMAQVQILRQTYLDKADVLELDYDSAAGELSYYTDFFNYL